MQKKLLSVIIKCSYVLLGNYCFANCWLLSSVRFPSVKKRKTASTSFKGTNLLLYQDCTIIDDFESSSN